MNDTNTPDVIIRGKAIKFHPFASKLGDVFDFTAHDLELNQDAKLSQKQKKRLMVRRNRLIAIWGSGGVILLLLLIGSVGDISQTSTVTQILIGIIPVWMLVTAFTIGRNRSQELERDLVTSLVEELTFSKLGKHPKKYYDHPFERRESEQYYMMQVGHLERAVNPSEHWALTNLSDRYDTFHVAVYYLAHSDEILSMVQVDVLNENMEDTLKSKRKIKRENLESAL